MRGLMAKEMTGLLGLYKKNLLLVGLVYGGLSIMTENSFFLYFGVWMMGFYSLSGYSLDEQSGWGRYARTLPISDFQVVAAKFVAAAAFMGIGTAYALVVGLILRVMDSEFAWLDFLIPLGLVVAIAAVCVSLMQLMAIRFGPDKARNYFLVVFFLLFAVFYLLGSRLGGFPVEEANRFFLWAAANPLVVAALILLVVAAVLGICLAVSVSLYRKKEF